MSIKHITDAAILAAVDEPTLGGGFVANVSDRLGLGGWARPALTRRLKAMEGRGLVERDESRSAVNAYRWRAKGRVVFPLAQLDEATLRVIGERPVRIWSGQWGAWWKPDGHGYTNTDSLAWVLPANVAFAEVKHCGPEKRISLVAARS